MGIDYYKVLEVNRNSTIEDMKKSYRRLGMQWHPDKNPDNEEAETKFREISKAYYVLSDPQKKAFYDQNGEEYFAEFFRTGVFRYNEGIKTGNSQKPPPLEHYLICTLDELYTGTTRKMKILRQVVDVSGLLVPEPEIFIVTVKPGSKKGTKISFANKGNELLTNRLASDLVFVIGEKPHNVYQRNGNDLIVTKTITLTEALLGTTVNLKSLDGRELNIPVTDIVSPEYELVIPDEGMPNSEGGNKGKLFIKFKVNFPTRMLSPYQKEIFKSALGQ